VSALKSWGVLDGDLEYVTGEASSSHRGWKLPEGGGTTGKPVPSEINPLSVILQSGLWSKISGGHHLHMQTTMFQPKGGMDMIARGFEGEVGDLITYGAKVTRIENTETGVRATWIPSESGGAETVDEADDCICTIPFSVLGQIKTNFSSRMDELEMSFLKARRAERDFLLRQDVGNIDRHAEAMTLLNERSAHARILARDTGGEVTGLLDGVDRLIKAYASGFASLVESHRLLGFNEDDGLQGALKAAVHEVEMVLKEASTPEMQVKMLMMRCHEKDFIMRVDPKYRDRLNARVEEFRAFPTDYYVDESQRFRIDNLLERYQKSFNAFVEETLREQRLQQDLSAAYSEVEPLVSRLHEVSRKRKNEVSYVFHPG
ncbi:FAD-dependent oxidoreductase, partial [Rhodovulum sulfidophilum]|uniref:FAD-dependent oxidoreductase n=1 Tax=Rhodovulum sulfidophilum TaxID=35806 RepID=UPI001EE438FC